jgi:glycogen debranching enzyme
VIEGQRALVVEPSGPGPLTLRPLLADSTQGSYYQLAADGGALAIARANHLVPLDANDFPVWLVVKAAGAVASVDPQLLTGGGLKPKMLSPGALVLAAPEPVVFAVGNTLAEAQASADLALAQLPKFKADRAARLQRLLTASYVHTEDLAFNRAEAWIRLSMDALVMNQQGQGIFAGLPWFNNYWGRDTFISLGGSHLVTGQWEEALGILRSFASHQDVDPASATFGRIPNTVGLGGTSYNTADGTPWFCIQAARYLLRAPDAGAATELWPVVQRATDGALAHVDASGFLTHGDQETWMDATGPAGPYTPRGDRAVDIQGLWYQQLLAAAAIADLAGQPALATGYRGHAAQVAAAFLGAYFDPLRGTLADRLQPDGGLDVTVRPNQLVALRAMGDVISAGQAQQITRSAATRLAYPHGVASLSPIDPGFHPWHILAGYYPKDEAYHNGVVWSWLSGPLVSLMVAQGAGAKAWEQLASLDDLALTTATVGTLPELMDALPRPVPDVFPISLGTGAPQPAGTPFQAWSHGEYLRNVYEDFLGVSYLASDHVQLRPALPPSWGAVEARFRLGGGTVKARLTPDAGVLDVELLGEGALPASAVVTVAALGQTRDVPLSAGADRRLSLAGTPPAATGWDNFFWRPLLLPAGLSALAVPGLVVLDRSAIKQAPGSDVHVRLSITDPAGDDTGPPGEHYTYPTDTHFQAGMFDLRAFELREDSDAFYFSITFQNLVQPGWNPADGFQLTYAAVLLDTGVPGRSTTVAHAAKYELPADAGYQYAIYVGAGFEVQDATGKPLASYTPQSADVIDPLGSVDTKAVTFRVPKAVLPALPAGTIVTVLGGSQDDHGNGSMGDFRLVSDVASQWVGGGQTLATDPNVYDWAGGVLGP